MNRILGIDLGATAIKAVAIEGSFRTHQLRGYREELLGPAIVSAETAPSIADAPTPLFPEPHDGSETAASQESPTGSDQPSADSQGGVVASAGSPDSPRTWEERALEALEALSQDGWLAADTVVCCLPSSQVASHIVTLPFHDARRIEQTLPFELEELIPFDIEDVIFDYQVLSKAPGKTVLLVMVARREAVTATLELLSKVGVDPNVVTFSAASLQHLVSAGYVPELAPKEEDEEAEEAGSDQSEESTSGENARETPDPKPAPKKASLARFRKGRTPQELRAQAIVDIGAERTNILIAENGALAFARTVSPAGSDVTRAVARALGDVSFDQAETYKKHMDLAGGDPTPIAAAELALGGLIRELRATFAAFMAHSHRPVERVTLCGGGSQLEGLAPLLADSLGIPVERLEVLNPKPLPQSEALPSGALALALGLHGAGGSRQLRLNFRRGEFAFTRDMSALRLRTRAFIAMAATLVLLMGANAWAKAHVLAKREARLDTVLCETTQRILGNCETDYRVALGKLKGQGSPAASVPKVSAVDLVQLVTRLFPPDKDAVLDDLDVVDTTVRLRGDAADYDVVEDVVAELQKNRCFGEVRKGRMVKKDSRIEFDIDAQYTCSQPPSAGAGS